MAESTNDSDPVCIERPAPNIGLLAIDRPAQRNALNLAVKRRLEAAVLELTADPAIRVIVITGRSGIFVAGTDISEMRPMTAADHATLGTNDLWVALRACPKPLVAAVEGYALGGGCELALSCDIIVAGESARFGQPEIKVGIMPGAGGTQYLLRTIGRYRAAKMILTGEMIEAREANAMGLVSELVPDGQALERALVLAGKIARMPEASVAGVKVALRAGLNAPLDEALVTERDLFVGLFGQADQQEGMQAFLEKRSPRFGGS